MSEYQVIARKFRPQTFRDVFGQASIVTTLKNAIKFKRTAQAYLFSGSRGTGKTTLARLLAKALNCANPSDDLEPCNLCPSCKEIASGSSMDVLEIDGASHRGIEDIRQINETVGYAAPSGHYKIYIIDEVHMLTKEAFNALLKTLEEPPAKVKFLFATTEPHKLPSTILSRCQRFDLARIPVAQIVAKLRTIAQSLEIEAEDKALHLLAVRAEGGLRDAESLFDQILAFESGKITGDSVIAILGMMPDEIFFEIDNAGETGDFVKAFEIADRVFSEGKDLTRFVDGLIDHLRKLLLVILSGKDCPLLSIPEEEKDRYEASARFYTREQCMDLIEYLVASEERLRLTDFGKITLESILLHVMRSHFSVPIECLVRKLSELEEAVSRAPSETPAPLPLPPLLKIEPTPGPCRLTLSVSEDPTPSPSDIGKVAKKATPKIPAASPSPVPERESTPVHSPQNSPAYKYDTLFHFAAVELEGKLQKN